MSPAELAIFKRAFSAAKSGSAEEAERLLLGLVNQYPRNSEAWIRLATIAFDSGRYLESAGWFEKALQIDPRNWWALSHLGRAKLQLGDAREALRLAQEAVKEKPGEPETMLFVGQCALAAGEFSLAEQILRGLRARFPDHGPTAHLHTLALLGAGNDEEAIGLAEEAVERVANEQTLSELVGVLIRTERFEEAVVNCRRLIAINPDSYEGNHGLATALAALGYFAEAERYWSIVLAKTSNKAPIHLLKAKSLSAWGDFDAAEVEFRKSIEVDARQGVAYHGILTSRKNGLSDRNFIQEAVEKLDVVPTLDPNERRFLHFGLGKAFEDLGEYEQAIRHYDEGNRLGREVFFECAPCPTELIDQPIRKNSEVFTEGFIASQRARGSDSDVPIFVVGMMRSGTTLVEQILSAHPEVGGAGEQMFWARLANRFVDYDREVILWDELDRGIAAYENRLKSVAPGFLRIVDKNPRNLMQAGLIHVAYPRAKIIYVHRSAINVALSIWTTLINSDAPFMGDRDATAYAILGARRMYEHWRCAIDPALLYEVRYEELVSNPQQSIRGLIDFCGLPWDDACLRPEMNLRSVRTPSVTQVRARINTRSVERYKRFEPWLGSFRQLVDEPVESEIGRMPPESV